MIRVEKIRKEFGKNAVALDDINLQIEDSTFIALLGPSGCGKSTTLRMIAGLEDISSGVLQDCWNRLPDVFILMIRM